MDTIVEWVSSAWDWLLNLNGFQGAAIAMSFAGLGYANGAWRNRRVASFKEVLVAEALLLHEREMSASGRAHGISVERQLRPAPMPGLAWGCWQRFRRRWLQVQHLPFRMRHYGCSVLLWSGAHSFNVILTWLTAPSRRAAFNQVLARYGFIPLTADEFERIDKPGTTIVVRLEHLGYLILEPALPRWRWQRARAKAARDASTSDSSEAATATPPGDDSGYCGQGNGQSGRSE